MHLFTSHHRNNNDDDNGYYGYYALCYWPSVKTHKTGNWLRVGQTGIHVACSASEYSKYHNNSFIE